MKRKLGFTLIELLVVIAIIGILAGVVGKSCRKIKAKHAEKARQEHLEIQKNAGWHNTNGW